MRSTVHMIVLVLVALMATSVAQAADVPGEYVHSESINNSSGEVKFTLKLEGGGNAQLTTSGSGALDANSLALRQVGSILTYLLQSPQRRVTHEGNWTESS